MGKPGELILGQRLRAVFLLEAPGGGIGEHLRPDRLGLANADGVAVLRQLLGIEEYMRPAHDDRDATAAELGGDVVGAQRMQRPRRDRDEIGGPVEIDLLHLLVEDRHGPFRRRQRGQVGQRQRHDLAALRLEHLAAVS